MRFRALLTLAVFALVASAQARGQEQQKDQQVIDDFVTTRGVTFEEPGKRQQKPAAPPPATQRRNNTAAPRKSGGANAAASGKTTAGKGGAAAQSNKGVAGHAGDGPASAAQVDDEGDADVQTLKAGGAALRPIALGYTILMKDDAGNLSVVDPSRVFKTNDRIAVTLETNADGYLYMFNASDGKNPELLFPNPQLDGGANAVQAHARATFPADPSLDFRFTDPPATEHLFVVFSREPLEGVPTGEELVRFCGPNPEDCAWKPTAAQWERIRDGARGRGVTEAKNAQLAQARQPVAPSALTRGLKLKRDDPKPAFVRVNNSPGANLLVTEIVLTHK